MEMISVQFRVEKQNATLLMADIFVNFVYDDNAFIFR